MSSSESRRQEATEQMWYAAEDCSRSVQRRLEKLGRRRLRVGYGEQTVHETMRNADAFETPTLLDDEVRQRGMTVPGHEDIQVGLLRSQLTNTSNALSHVFDHWSIVTVYNQIKIINKTTNESIYFAITHCIRHSLCYACVLYFCRAMLCISPAYAVMWCLSVSVYVCVCHVHGSCQNE